MVNGKRGLAIARSEDGQCFPINVNGSVHAIEADEKVSLLSVLRDQLDLTGTKYGCGEGACGACTAVLFLISITIVSGLGVLIELLQADKQITMSNAIGNSMIFFINLNLLLDIQFDDKEN